MAQQEIAVPGERLCIGRDGNICPEQERLLAKCSGRRVVHGNEGTFAMGEVGHMPDVTNVEARIAWGFKPEQPRAFQNFRLPIAGGWREPGLDAD
jgi:hypothetical protein